MRKLDLDVKSSSHFFVHDAFFSYIAMSSVSLSRPLLTTTTATTTTTSIQSVVATPILVTTLPEPVTGVHNSETLFILTLVTLAISAFTLSLLLFLILSECVQRRKQLRYIRAREKQREASSWDIRKSSSDTHPPSSSLKDAAKDHSFHEIDIMEMEEDRDVNETKRECQRPGIPSSDVDDLIRQHTVTAQQLTLHATQKACKPRPGIMLNRSDEFTFSTTASTQPYPYPRKPSKPRPYIDLPTIRSRRESLCRRASQTSSHYNLDGIQMESWKHFSWKKSFWSTESDKALSSDRFSWLPKEHAHAEEIK